MIVSQGYYTQGLGSGGMVAWVVHHQLIKFLIVNLDVLISLTFCLNSINTISIGVSKFLSYVAAFFRACAESHETNVSVRCLGYLHEKQNQTQSLISAYHASHPVMYSKTAAGFLSEGPIFATDKLICAKGQKELGERNRVKLESAKTDPITRGPEITYNYES